MSENLITIYVSRMSEEEHLHKLFKNLKRLWLQAVQAPATLVDTNFLSFKENGL